jgi:hypothetical protein
MSPFQPHFVTFEQFYRTIHRIFTTFLLFFSKLKAVGNIKWTLVFIQIFLVHLNILHY